MMKDITHYFHSPLSANGRVASTASSAQCLSPATESNSAEIKKKRIKSVKNAVVDDLKRTEVKADESSVPSDTQKTPKKKKKRKADSSISSKESEVPSERTTGAEKAGTEKTKALPINKEVVKDAEIKSTKADRAGDKNQTTNAFHILMSPKTKPVLLEPAVDDEEMLAAAAKENISLDSSGKLKLSTKSKKRKKKVELEEENDDRNKTKRAKYDQAKESNTATESDGCSKANSVNDEIKENKATKKQNLQNTRSEVKADSKLTIKNKRQRAEHSKTSDSKDKSIVDSCKLSSKDSSNEVINSDVPSSEKTVSNNAKNVKKNENELPENKQKKKTKLSLNKNSPNLLRKHASPENSLLIVSPESQTAVKTPNSLFKYFNRVNSSETEKIEVKALVHSPPVKITKLRQHLNGNATIARNGILSPSRRVAWKLRVKLRSKEQEDEIIADNNGEDSASSDDYIFTPKKKQKRKVSVQQQAASMVVKKAMVVLTKIKSPKSPLVINRSAASPKKLLSPNKQKAVMNLAPLFTRVKSRNVKKVDAAVVEARRNFLKSGVPEQVKRILDIQRSMEEQEHYVFPTIAHVQQRDDTIIWKLPTVPLPSKSHYISPQLQEVLKLGEFSEAAADLPTPQTPSETITHHSFKALLEGIKAAYPEFPVYRTFKRLRAKDAAHTNSLPKEEVVKQKRRSRRMKKAASEEESVVPELVVTHKMWTEKYKPLSGQEVIGNGYCIGRLRKWLEAWKRYSEEAHKRAATSTKKKKKEDASSGDEFVDSDSGDSVTSKLPDNTVILVGPYGSGKTCAVYAIANELGFKVLEINSSSKRNGKRILSELQEATQSHQVQAKGDQPASSINSFFKTAAKPTDKSKKPKSTLEAEVEEDATSSRMSLILVEGVEVVYEDHDEGFISALNTLVASSKRPVILVTSDADCAHISRFMDHHLVLKFRQPPITSLSVWLQLVCLLEGLSVNRAEIERLLDLNSGDVRRTLLQLQFWALSGGDRVTDTVPNTLPAPTAVVDDDEQSNISWDSAPQQETLPENSSIVGTFMDSQLSIEGVPVSYPADLEHVWWNTAPLLSLTEVQADRLSVDVVADDGQEEPEVKPQVEEGVQMSEEVTEVQKCRQTEVDAMATLMDTLSHIDTLQHTKKHCVTQGIWKQPAKDGISLHQDMNLCHWRAECTSHHISNFLLQHALTSCRRNLNSEQACQFKLARPSQKDFNWEAAQNADSRAVLPAVPLWNQPHHRAVCLDFLPLLRTLIRYEKDRLSANTKRGNRFFHYLKGLNVHAGEATFYSLSQVFTTKQ